ncbi:MAG: hypothetical protein Q7U08_00110 [Flavobacteriaceae bacterium]|nr:hypothetical protein [Flavobacteriaceae bacterium]
MNLKIDLLFKKINLPEIELKNEKIGKLVRETLPIILLEKLIPETEIKKLQEDNYSKFTFDMNYPILKKIDTKLSILENRMTKDHTRYYAEVFENGDDLYLITSEWYERNLEDYIKWMKRKVKV